MSPEQEFQTLPATLQRKYFSSLERFHLTQDGSLSTPSWRKDQTLRASPDYKQSQPPLEKKIPSLTRARSSSRRVLRKPHSIRSQFLASQINATWFSSLPQKIQQCQFTREEQILFASHRDTGILDAADKASYKLGRRPNTSGGSQRTDLTFQGGQNKDTIDPASTVDAGIAMEDNLCDTFWWLDEDDDLDLTLDGYHHAVTETTRSPTLGGWRRPSVRRALSLTSLKPRLAPVSPKIIHSNYAAVVQSQPQPGLAARPSSSLFAARHERKSSVSSIEPAAKHYQDPEARLKLRVYLASPQKFDEAVEFGFPSLSDPELMPAASPTTPRETEETERTFLDDAASLPSEAEDDKDEDLSLADSESPRTPQDAIVRPLRPLRQNSMDRAGLRRPHVLRNSPDPYARGHPGGREMTLHMTLTRPDLRIETEIKPGPAKDEDPLKLSDLPLSHERHPVWDSAADERSKVKNLWKKLKSR